MNACEIDSSLRGAIAPAEADETVIGCPLLEERGTNFRLRSNGPPFSNACASGSGTGERFCAMQVHMWLW